MLLVQETISVLRLRHGSSAIALISSTNGDRMATAKMESSAVGRDSRDEKTCGKLEQRLRKVTIIYMDL